jgi:hypothetical protein
LSFQFGFEKLGKMALSTKTNTHVPVSPCTKDDTLDYDKKTQALTALPPGRLG